MKPTLTNASKGIDYTEIVEEYKSNKWINS
jgi:hypothetical protein